MVKKHFTPHGNLSSCLWHILFSKKVLMQPRDSRHIFGQPVGEYCKDKRFGFRHVKVLCSDVIDSVIIFLRLLVPLQQRVIPEHSATYDGIRNDPEAYQRSSHAVGVSLKSFLRMPQSAMAVRKQAGEILFRRRRNPYALPALRFAQLFKHVTGDIGRVYQSRHVVNLAERHKKRQLLCQAPLARSGYLPRKFGALARINGRKPRAAVLAKADYAEPRQ